MNITNYLTDLEKEISIKDLNEKNQNQQIEIKTLESKVIDLENKIMDLEYYLTQLKVNLY